MIIIVSFTLNMFSKRLSARGNKYAEGIFGKVLIIFIGMDFSSEFVMNLNVLCSS